MFFKYIFWEGQNGSQLCLQEMEQAGCCYRRTEVHVNHSIGKSLADLQDASGGYVERYF